jgi:hypothetical protein
LYFAGFGSLFFIFIVAPLVSIVDSQSFYLMAISAFLLLEALYRAYAYYHFMNRRGAKPLLYALLAAFTAVGLWISLSTFSIQYYINNGLPHLF